MRLETHKKIIREAAALTRDFMLLYEEKSIVSQQVVVASIARAVARQDLSLAKRLLRVSSVAAAHIVIEGRTIRLIDAAVFRRFTIKLRGAT